VPAFAQVETDRSNFEQAAPRTGSYVPVMAAIAAGYATKEITMLKTLVIGAAVATLLGTTALAQSYDPDEGGGNVNPPIASLQGAETGNGAYAYAPQAMRTTRIVQNGHRQRSMQDQQDK
jgi:hypothetical protein